MRTLNTSYLMPLQSTFPANRLSVEGDGPKVGCTTCHKGTFKPLYGASSLKDYPVLAGVTGSHPGPVATDDLKGPSSLQPVEAPSGAMQGLAPADAPRATVVSGTK